MASLRIDNLKTDISKHVGFRWWERMDSNHRSEDATDLQGKLSFFMWYCLPEWAILIK